MIDLIKNGKETGKVIIRLAITITLFTQPVYALSDCAEGEVNCWDCGKTEADLCTARLNTTTKALSITGTGEMRDYPGAWDSIHTPWGKNYTSVSVDGVKNIGDKAFENSNITSANISDSVTAIGKGAFDACYSLQQVNIPDSVTSIGAFAFFNDHALYNTQVFISESVTDIETFIHTDVDNKIKGPFESNEGQQYTLYCAETTPCYASNSDKIITYTKDENGVYKIDNNYYASPYDMVVNNSCGSGNSASQACIDAATVYQNQKAENMAGGALCATKEGCLELIDMANKKDVCSSIADCNSYAKNHYMASILCEKGLFRQGGNCVSSCGANYRFNNGICHRVRYTPAEIAKVVGETNTIFLFYK